MYMYLNRCLVLQNFIMDTNTHDIIVTEAFCAALFRVKIAASEEGSEGVCFYAGLNKVWGGGSCGSTVMFLSQP